jgi:hypothetical protein
MTVLAPPITETDLKNINLSIQQLAAGRSNATGSFTITINAGTTVVITRTGTCAPSSVPILMPKSVNGATEYGAGNWYISSVGLDTFTVTHTNSATANRDFYYVIVG